MANSQPIKIFISVCNFTTAFDSHLVVCSITNLCFVFKKEVGKILLLLCFVRPIGPVRRANEQNKYASCQISYPIKTIKTGLERMISTQNPYSNRSATSHSVVYTTHMRLNVCWISFLIGSRSLNTSGESNLRVKKSSMVDLLRSRLLSQHCRKAFRSRSSAIQPETSSVCLVFCLFVGIALAFKLLRPEDLLY